MYILTRIGSISFPTSVPIFDKTVNYSLGVFFQKWVKKNKLLILCQNIRLYVTWLHSKNESHSSLSFLENVD